MIASTEPQKKSMEELNESIIRAMGRVNAEKETDLCQYIPGKKGRLHHFAFEKLKKTRPQELKKMIKEFILERENPEHVPSHPRRGLMVKRTVDIKLKRSQINRLVDILKKSGEEELLSMLSPHQSLNQVQKLMIEMIKEKNVNHDLWQTYVKLVEEEKAILQ